MLKSGEDGAIQPGEAYRAETTHRTTMLSPFDREGNLPPGIHWADWNEFQERFGTSPYRKKILAGLSRALEALRQAHCGVVYIDGSFVTAKIYPGDFDGCWSVAGVDPTRLDPVLLDFSNRRAAQKAKFLGELFPAELPEGGSGKTWLEFFRQDREGRPKGIVAIDLRGCHDQE